MSTDSPHSHSPSDLAARLAVMEARRSCVRGLVHDFNNVMVGLCSFSEGLLIDLEPDDPRYEDLELIRESAFRAHGLLRTIGNINRGEDTDPGPINLALWLPTQEQTYSALLDKGARVEFKLADDLPAVAVSDQALRDLLLVIVSEVSTNLERRGVVTLEWHKAGEVVEATVTGNPAAWQTEESLLVARALAETAGGSLIRNDAGVVLRLPAAY